MLDYHFDDLSRASIEAHLSLKDHHLARQDGELSNADLISTADTEEINITTGCSHASKVKGLQFPHHVPSLPRRLRESSSRLVILVGQTTHDILLRRHLPKGENRPSPEIIQTRS
ncbi:hypothetical protein HO173_010216 [Letharia columbiana]|uniref:Uncharacterized protein n=1 Tax=Letharia columbiana TaxID=112416 RepID=A0A8H6L0Y6_9LECA|nr:uncharacterized protein HO173_010216 [Letharia columbiana]KAF6231464.1 hypothetical protein HO173_010216 [Letharia columbiana]